MLSVERLQQQGVNDNLCPLRGMSQQTSLGQISKSFFVAYHYFPITVSNFIHLTGLIRALSAG